MIHMEKRPEKYFLLTFHFEITLDLQKSYKELEFSLALHSASPNDNILHNHRIVVKNQEMNIDIIQLGNSYLNFTSFPTNVYFLFQDLIQDLTACNVISV